MHIMQCTDTRHLRRNQDGMCVQGLVALLGALGTVDWMSVKSQSLSYWARPMVSWRGIGQYSWTRVLNPGLLSMGSQVGFLPGLHIQNALRVPSLLPWLWLGDGEETWWINLGSWRSRRMHIKDTC